MTKILLVTDVPPNAKFSGGLLTLRLAEGIFQSEIHGYYIVSDALQSVRSELPSHIETKAQYHRKPVETSMRKLFLGWSRLSFIGAAAREFYRKYWQCYLIRKRIEKVVQTEGIEKVWIILQGQTMIWVAESLIRSGRVAVHVQYWDSPGWWIRANQIDRISAVFIWRSFAYCLANAKRTATPSHHASEAAWNQDRKTTYPLIGTVADEIRLKPMLPRDRPIKIGIAGQLYAYDAIVAFVSSLKELNWKICGRPVEIHYWGSTYSEYLEPYFVRHEYLPQNELMIQLQDCDILYCPYWFDPAFRTECETSFPSKLVTYFLLNRLVFFHGPSYSGPSKLIRRFDAGIVCNSSSFETIKYYLRSIFSDPRATLRKMENAQRLYDQLLTKKVVAANFRDFLDV